jgi:ATP-dependent DNA helicase RecG
LLASLRQATPGQLLECLPDADGGRLAEAMVAFANGDGGTVLVGVDEAGRPTGSVFPEDVDGALRSAELRCHPPVQTNWEMQDLGGVQVIAISVPRSTELHSLSDGRVLVRIGTVNKPLGGEAIRQLAATKSSADYEAELVPGATRADLDETMIGAYLAEREKRGRKHLGLPDELLVEIGAMMPAGQSRSKDPLWVSTDLRPTTSGILLFGRNPQAYFPHSSLVVVKFLGTEPRGEGGLPGYGRREEIGGPLARVIERAWQVTLEEMRIGAVVKGLEREEKTEYPPFAVREALVNAVCHRDYRLRGRRIEIRMFSDRMEVISPGGLPGFITVDNIVEEHFSRNPRIVAGLFQWGYIEELGLGIDRMIEEMTQAGHPPPQFKAQPHSFTVTLSNVRERRAVPVWEKAMNERQVRALTYIREHSSITNREYQQLCPDVSAETLRIDLVDLVNRGVLLRIGAKKGTYYILK